MDDLEKIWFRSAQLTPGRLDAADEALAKKIEQDARRILTQTAINRLRPAFGPQGLPFFRFYKDLRKARLGKKLPYPDLWEEFRQRARLLLRTKLSAPVANSVQETVNEIKPWLRAVSRDPENSAAWRKVILSLSPLLEKVARDKEVYLKPRTFGSERWTAFQAMRKSDEKLEKIRDTDPALFELIEKYKDQLLEIDLEIENAIDEAGLRHERRFLYGRPIHVGVDPNTGEEVVYDRVDRNPIPLSDYIDQRKKEVRSLSRQAVVRPTDQQLAQMRKVSDQEIGDLTTPLEYSSLTDAKFKQAGLTRIYPVKVGPDGRQVIVSGRFKGHYLDEMVNAAGRMIEGTAYNVDPKTGRRTRMEVRSRDGKGNPIVQTDREPYVTATNAGADRSPKLFLKIPSTKAFTEVRRQMRKLAKMVPSIDYVEKTRSSEFIFDPKDFESVREALAGMAMSDAASKLIREHFEKLAFAEMATAKENLSHYELGALGGFKQTRVRETPLLVKQMQALAWLEARGNNGVLALDTGIGKTATSVAMMQKLKRDGLWEDTDANNGRYLYVSPKALKGNIVKEVRDWLQEESARELLGRLDVLSYPQFGNRRRKDPKFGEDYIAVFFDEAQDLKNIGSPRSTSRMALSLNHPRKILLTASPLEKQPSEAYVLAAIPNNLDLGAKGAKGREDRRDMRKFRDRFSEVVGGRVVGMKDDPIVRREMQTWVKQNIFYGEKTDVEEFVLPALKRQTIVVTMDPAIENAYREELQEVRKALRAMVVLWRDKGRDIETGNLRPEARERQVSQIFTPRMAKLLRRLFMLSNNPAKVMPAVPVLNAEGEPVRDPETGEVRMRPTSNPKILESVRIVATERETRGGRTLMFTDDPAYVDDAAQQMSLLMPGLYHVAAKAREINIFQDGNRIEKYDDVFPMPFREKNYRLFPNEPAGTNNRHYKKAEWQTFVFREIVSPDGRIATATLAGQTYQVGQNLQAFSQVIHLDRDSWNAEDMKQRTARAWRQGQENSVQEFTLDMTYADPTDPFDRTLDEIRRYVQEVDEEMFNRIIKDSQSLALGKEFFDMRRTQAKYYDIDRKSLELALSPYLDNSDVPSRS